MEFILHTAIAGAVVFFGAVGISLLYHEISDWRWLRKYKRLDREGWLKDPF